MVNDNISSIMSDYALKGTLPTVDALLDWRNKLTKLKIDASEVEIMWLNSEISAVDILLNKHNK